MIWPFRQPELRVLVVCTANICRSPVAEALLRQRLADRGLTREVAVASAGTAVASPGARPDPRMVTLASELGVSLRGIRARAATPAVVAASDIIWVMEPRHADDLRERCPDAATRVALFDPDGTAIPDPFFSDLAGLQSVFARLEALAEGRADELVARLAAPRPGY
ncbi:MAG: low molecular weight phosphotyrosine protein phosphatase [Halieaceae bacterium]|jgi:protein-tyrosine phosphatase|nr:low molecular weight phosphotyrosine protein phosphatase [Halieaceae bacterium]